MGKIYHDGGLTHERVTAVLVDLPNQHTEKSQDGEHAENGGESSQHVSEARQ